MATKKEVKKKICPICKKEKTIATGFYKSASPLYQDDKCVPICITCVKDGIVNSEDGTINKAKMKTMLQRLDKPLYWDDLDSAYNQYKKEHGYLSDNEIAKHGKDIVGLYFKNTMLRQNRDKSFADSELDGHMHSNSNIIATDKDRINKKYIANENNNTSTLNLIKDVAEEEVPVVLRKKDDFEVTEDMVNLFGEGYTRTEYKKMSRKYEEMKQT